MVPETTVPWWRAFIFGDYHADSHHFVESPLQRVPKEIGCALAASLLVSPLVSIIDKCIVQEISGTTQFAQAIVAATGKMIRHPGQFFGGLPFRLTAFVYFGTYAVANLSELVLDTSRIHEDEQRKRLKVTAASAANISLLAWRDSVFAREYSNPATRARGTPPMTIALFAMRDASTMYATFYMAPRAASMLTENYGTERNTAELAAALAIPVITQFLTAPLHIHAMDIYNKPSASWSERLATIQAELRTVAFARGLRILPAFGIGSFSNNKFRELFIKQPDESLLLRRRVTSFLPSNGGAGRFLEE